MGVILFISCFVKMPYFMINANVLLNKIYLIIYRISGFTYKPYRCLKCSFTCSSYRCMNTGCI